MSVWIRGTEEIQIISYSLEKAMLHDLISTFQNLVFYSDSKSSRCSISNESSLVKRGSKKIPKAQIQIIPYHFVEKSKNLEPVFR